MRLEDQVCTPEQGAKLEKLGVTAPAYFMWIDWAGPEPGPDYRPAITKYDLHGWDCVGIGMAYSVAELGVMLSLRDVDDFDIPKRLEPNKFSQIYSAKWIADMVIHELEIGVVTAEQINESLNK